MLGLIFVIFMIWLSLEVTDAIYLRRRRIW